MLVAAAGGCSKLGSANANDASATAPGDSVESVREAPDSPMSTVESVAAQIQAMSALTVGGIGAFEPSRQRAAVTWLASYLARAHGDPAWLCSTSSRLAGSPTASVATSAFAKRFAQGNYGQFLEPRFSGKAGGKKACVHAHLGAPGVVVGPQTFTTNPETGQLGVTYLGLFAYRVVDSSGLDEPMNGSFGATYDLVPRGSGWRISGTEGRYFATIYSGWPLSLPLPHNYRGVVTNPPPVGNSPTALSEVRAAISTTLRAVGVRWRVEDSTDFPQTGKHRDYNSTIVASLAGGYGQSRSGRELFFKHGLEDLTPLRERVYADPGLTVPANPKWVNYNPAAVGKGPTYAYESEPYDTSPFAWTALLNQTIRATPAACPASLSAQHCYAATVDAANAAYEANSAAIDLGWEFVLGGEHTPTMTIGVSDGRLAGFVRGEFPVKVFGTLYQETQQIVRIDYLTERPPKPKHPAPLSIIEDGTYNFD
jgi:hypothetical protein